MADAEALARVSRERECFSGYFPDCTGLVPALWMAGSGRVEDSEEAEGDPWSGHG